MDSAIGGKREALPTPREIRRACGRELYRAVKRMNAYIPPNLMKKAEELYFRKVIANLLWIHENHSNRKRLSDWWEEEVCPEIAQLWEVEPDKLAKAFRQAFGG